MDIQLLTIKTDNSVKKALEALNINGLGTLFVINRQNKLEGIITDGDIRRALLKGARLDDDVVALMNRQFTSLSIHADNDQILGILSKKIKIIPLVNDQMQLVDYASIDRLRNISISSPLLEGNELQYITDCIKTNWISSQGKYVRQFEKLFEEYHDGFHALAVSNGTVALHLAMEALGIGKGDEVIVPDLTFAASINAILYTGATPVLVDVDENSWNLDVRKLKALMTSKTKAIMPVHLYGLPCNMEAVVKFAEESNLLIVEDCAEALGSSIGGKPVGVFGDAATFSFFGNKTITTGEGGMIVFRDKQIAERAATLRDHGMNKNKRYWHDEVGYNYRLTNLQAAIGVAQFERLDEFVCRKRKIASLYNESLEQLTYFQLPESSDQYYNSFWLYTFLIKPDAPFTREDLIEFLKQKAIETRPVFYPLHVMPPYSNFGKPEGLKTSAMVSQTGMSLPSAVSLSEREVVYICDCIVQFVKSFDKL